MKKEKKFGDLSPKEANEALEKVGKTISDKEFAHMVEYAAHSIGE